MTSQNESVTEYREGEDIALILQDQGVRYWNRRRGHDSFYEYEHLERVEVAKEWNGYFLALLGYGYALSLSITMSQRGKERGYSYPPKLIISRFSLERFIGFNKVVAFVNERIASMRNIA